MNKMKPEDYERVMGYEGYKLLPKVVFKITGNPIQLIKGITTNDEKADKNAFIDNFGKLIVLFDQKLIENEWYVVFEKQFEERFQEHIERFVRLNKSKLEKLNLNVYHIIGKDIETDGIKINQRIGYLLLAKELKEKLDEISDDAYGVIRIENDISIQGIDFDKEMLLNTNWTDVVSFTKGCFLGQEIMARVHNLGKPPKKLVRIIYDKVPEKVTSEGKEVGNITSKCFSTKYGKYLVFAFLPYDLDKVDDGIILG
ncbi:hypothetical protein HYX19_02405 [Candidatus Woesearchaeota archaeon]|nr:hypothetical protein [Candidatus Woesearchaeota archaeon]